MSLSSLRKQPVSPPSARQAAADLLAPLDPQGPDPRAGLEAQLQRHVRAARVELLLTNNASTMISVRSEPGVFRVRLHQMFAQAGPEIVVALARYVERDDRAASILLNRYIDRHATRIRRPRRERRAPRPLEPRGEAHDLGALFDELNRRYFSGAIRAGITWGARLSPALRGRERRSVKLGSYCVEDRLIRIHPSLDRSCVPVEFLGWIVYHEMLHQKHDIPLRGGRRQFHTPAFLADEARYEHYETARRWEREHLALLLTY
jgi:hypothetical protein